MEDADLIASYLEKMKFVGITIIVDARGNLISDCCVQNADKPYAYCKWTTEGYVIERLVRKDAQFDAHGKFTTEEKKTVMMRVTEAEKEEILQKRKTKL